LYSTDLACIHDAGFNQFSERAAPEIARILRRHGIRPSVTSNKATRIVEVGCGSGTLARHLAGGRLRGCRPRGGHMRHEPRAAAAG